MRQEIQRVFGEVFIEFGFGLEVPILSDEDILLESGMDSMGFAILITTLESELGFDPFAISEDPTYPSTFGEFVIFYESNRP